MATDRDTMRRAEKLLRQGRLDAAIAEYARVIEANPHDWTTANTLGDLYVRTGQPDRAAAEYGRIADHYFTEGFLPKAAAVYKKILKIKPEDEAAQLRLSDVAARQGLLADAKEQLAAIAQRRRARGDQRGANEIEVRLGSIDPTDLDARIIAARALASLGDETAALATLRELATDISATGRKADARDVLREIVRLDPADISSRFHLARAYLEAGDPAAARECLPRDLTAEDPSLLLMMAEIDLRTDHLDEARQIVADLARDRVRRSEIAEMAWSLFDTNPAEASICIDALADGSIAAGDWDAAVSALRELVTRVPNHIPALLRLVEVCVDGGLDADLLAAQAQLADAYLSSAMPAEARFISEDLVTREPHNAEHVERLRRALVMLDEPDPDAIIADRLSEPLAAPSHPAARSGKSGISSGARQARPGPATPAPGTAPETRTGNGSAERIPMAARSAEVDLTAMVEDLASPGSPPSRSPDEGHDAESAEPTFNDFHDEVSRETSTDSAAQHYKLALAYRDIGMIDEAMRALEVSVRVPRFRFDAASLLGRLCRQRQRIPQAIEWFERATEAPAPTIEEGRALLYDLACTLEEGGETSRALAVLLELQNEANDYRDVRNRIERLSRVQTGG